MLMLEGTLHAQGGSLRTSVAILAQGNMSQNTKKPRRPRPDTCSFKPGHLVKQWDDLASRRKPGFEWDGSSYGASRGGIPDRDGLVMHAAPLRELLAIAPTGFPSHPSLVATLTQLDEKYQGLLNTTKRFHEKAASLGADQWRIMCKHVYELAKDPPGDLCEKLQALVKQIKIKESMSASTSAASSKMLAPAAETIPQSKEEALALFPILDSDMEVVSLSSSQEEEHENHHHEHLL